MENAKKTWYFILRVDIMPLSLKNLLLRNISEIVFLLSSFLLLYSNKLLYLYPADQHWDQIHNCHWHQGYHLCQSHHYCHKHCQKYPRHHQLDPHWQLWGNYHMHHCKKRLYVHNFYRLIFIKRYHHSRYLKKIWSESNSWKISI